MSIYLSLFLPLYIYIEIMVTSKLLSVDRPPIMEVWLPARGLGPDKICDL